MAVTPGLDHNVVVDRPSSTTAGLDHNSESPRSSSLTAGLDHDAQIRSVQLMKPKEIAKDNRAGEGIQAGHFDPGALSADAKGRAAMASGFFDAATAADKIEDGAIPAGKLASIPGGPPTGSATGDLGGSYPSPTVSKSTTAFALDAALTPAALSTDQNDYNPGSLAGANVLRLSASQAVNVTGLAGGASGRVLVVHNTGSFSIVLKSQSSSSTAANRFAFDADVTLAADQSVTLRYDATSSRWRSVSTVGSGGGGGGGGTATALATTGAAVDVASGAPPTAGQVLTSTDATHASFQNIAQVSATSAVMLKTAPQTVPAGFSFVPLTNYQTVVSQHGSIDVDLLNGKFICKVAGTYVIFGRVFGVNPGSSDWASVAVGVNGAFDQETGRQETSVTTALAAPKLVDLQVGDYVQAAAIQGTNNFPWGAQLSIALIAPIATAVPVTAKVGKSVSQNVLNGNGDVITFDAIVYDETGLRNATDRFTIKNPGRYRVTSYLNGTASGQNTQPNVFTLIIQHFDSAGVSKGFIIDRAPAAANMDSVASYAGDFAPGDYVQVLLQNNCGATVAISNASWVEIAQSSIPPAAIPDLGRLQNVPLVAKQLGVPFKKRRSYQTTVGTGPSSIAFDGRYLWVSSFGGGDNVKKVDPLTSTVVATISTGTTPLGLAFDGTYIYSANYGAGTVSKINPVTNTVVATITVGTTPQEIAFDGTYLWVTNYGSGNVSKIDPSSNTVVATVTTAAGPVGVCFDGQYVWIANFDASSISKIDPVTNAVLTTFAAGGTNPHRMCFDGQYVWVCLYSSSAVAKIDPVGNSVLTTISVGATPLGIAYDGQSVWVSNNGSTTVSKIDPFKNSVVDTLTTGTAPAGSAYDGSFLWVALSGASNAIIPIPVGPR